MIDLHCHLLPGIDDGPPDLVGSVALARALVATGVETVAATPHVAPAHPNDAAGIAAAREAVVAELARQSIPLQVVRGAELDLLHLDTVQDVGALQLGEGGTLLVECPFAAVAPFFEQRLSGLWDQGFRTLLAHPERSPAFLREPALLERLVARGAMASITASSLVGAFGRTARRYAAWVIDEGLVHDVASDAHDVARRAPGLREPLEGAGYGWAVDWLTDEAPRAILAGDPLPPAPRAPARRRLRLPLSSKRR